MDGGATEILVADAEFLSSMPDHPPASTIGKAVAALSAAGRLITVLDAKRHAEASYQAVVNSPSYQAIPAQRTSNARRAKARVLANQAPIKLMTRHAGVTELIVVAAAQELGGSIVTVRSSRSYYGSFDPPLRVPVFVVEDLPGLV